MKKIKRKAKGIERKAKVKEKIESNDYSKFSGYLCKLKGWDRQKLLRKETKFGHIPKYKKKMYILWRSGEALKALKLFYKKSKLFKEIRSDLKK